MKRVLFVTYYFPPSGGPGVQRVLKYVKYLPQFGWQPVVLTVENGDFPARDESLLKEIPTDCLVHRTKIYEPYELYRRLTGKLPGAAVDVENIPVEGEHRSLAERIADFVRSTFFIPDARIGWYWSAVRKGVELVKSLDIEAIYSSSPPYTTSVIARDIHRKTGVPWVAGFRDPWTGFLSAPKRWFLPAAVDRHLEHTVYNECNYLEAAWEGILEDFRIKYPDVPEAKGIHIPNGFDGEDFPADVEQEKETFTIAYTGSMYGKRNPFRILRAAEELVDEGKITQGNFRLKFIGRFGGEVRDMVNRSSVKEHVELVPYLPHGESVRELLKAHALLLIVDEFDVSSRIVPGKVFEYIGANRPIIALAPEGAVSQIIEETGSGFCVSHHDMSAVKAAFLKCYLAFQKGERILPEGRAVERETYERKELTRHLAELFDRVSHH